MTKITMQAMEMGAKTERLFGAPAIAKAIGLSVDAIPRLARTPGVPIYRPTGLGRYFAYRTELERWLRTKPDGG